MKKHVAILMLALCMCAVMFGCGKKDKEEKDAKAKTEQSGVENPLTGEKVSKKYANTRPVAVMISNIIDALPQYGTSNADIIYECPVEGGLTRMMAIYQDYSGMDRIGSVRSCRLYFPQIANEFNAIYVHFGQSKYAESYLDSDEVDNLNGLDGVGNVVFYRTDDKPAPHNAFTSSDGIKAGIEKKEYTKKNSNEGTHYQFAEEGEEVKLDGEKAAVIEPGYAVDKPWFVYDKKEKVYKRYEYKEAQMDAATNEQLTFKNVLIQICDSEYEDDDYTLSIDVKSGGKGYYATNGKVIPVTWKIDSKTGSAKYYNEDGEEITMNRGKTWVCVVQDSYAEKVKFYASENAFEKAKEEKK